MAVDPTAVLTLALFIGSSVHIAATWWLFGMPAVRRIAARHRARYMWAPLGLVVVSAAVAASVPSHDLDLLLLGYFSWQFHHYQKQNLGIAALYAAEGQTASLSRGERICIIGAGWFGIAGLLLHPNLLQLASVSWQPRVPFRIVAVGFAMWTLVGAIAMTRRHDRDRAWRFCTAYLTALYFPLPIFVFASPYAAVGSMTIVHGLQYLVLVGMVTAGGRSPATRRTTLAGFAVAVVGLGLILSVTSHLHRGGTVAHAFYGAYLGIVMSHFVIDAGIWRMRDPAIRRFLTTRLPHIFAHESSPNVSADGVRSSTWQTETLAASAGMPALQR